MPLGTLLLVGFFVVIWAVLLGELLGEFFRICPKSLTNLPDDRQLAIFQPMELSP